ncbi:MAG: PH domain-containing protein [Gemmatimonadaceae bacterium]|nr:PH domain-containing protein [Gemmatimonadaceae bacterium]
MYEWLKSIILPLLRIEGGEPHPPAGHVPAEIRRIERAAPGYLRLKLFWWGLYAAAWGLAVVIASTLLLVADVRLLLLVIPLILVALAKAATLYVTMRLDYELRWYVLTDRSLMIREGVWNVKEITLTYANAQNVRVTQGPLERLFGFSTVEVETAGGGSGENGMTPHLARLPGLAHPHEVRDLILDGVRRVGTTGLGDLDDHPARATAAGAAGSVLPPPARQARPATTEATLVMQEVWDEARALRVALERRPETE